MIENIQKGFVNCGMYVQNNLATVRLVDNFFHLYFTQISNTSKFSKSSAVILTQTSIHCFPFEFNNKT